MYSYRLLKRNRDELLFCLNISSDWTCLASIFGHHIWDTWEAHAITWHRDPHPTLPVRSISSYQNISGCAALYLRISQVIVHLFSPLSQTGSPKALTFHIEILN